MKLPIMIGTLAIAFGISAAAPRAADYTAAQVATLSDAQVHELLTAELTAKCIRRGVLGESKASLASNCTCAVGELTPFIAVEQQRNMLAGGVYPGDPPTHSPEYQAQLRKQCPEAYGLAMANAEETGGL